MNRASLRVFLVENSAVRQALSGPYQRQAVKRIHASGIFHRPWYEAQVGRTFESDKAAVRDFVEVGRRAGFSPHPLVWPEWYSPGRWDWAWPEPTLQILHPRSVDLGSPLFDQDAYIAAVAQARTWADGPLAHFLGPQLPGSRHHPGRDRPALGLGGTHPRRRARIPPARTARGVGPGTRG